MHSGVPPLPDRIPVEVPDGSKSITADFHLIFFAAIVLIQTGNATTGN
jgi:hypothetical protein